ncbi:methyl-accepting chemotaxis protein [Clostridium thermarum]|uniref:methyl-accepting chemotaxis protein n=1 Tax=Clostridium thermarum TaxID=1716543 RepID=UPI001122F914|nr:methyl-accepting chemotaxis protein [Clostridium thermarum]
MKKFKAVFLKRGKLRHKLCLILVLSALIPAIISVAITLNISKNIVEEKVNNLTKQVATEKIAFIDNLLETARLSVDNFTKDDLVLSGNKEGILLTASHHRTSNSNYFQYYVGKENKEFIIYPQKEMPKDYDPTQRGWYKEANNSFGNIVITKPYKSSSTGLMMVTVAKAFKLNDGTAAVAGIDITLESLIENILKTKVGNTGYATLILGDGTIIVHPDKDMIMINISEKYSFGKEVIAKKTGNLKYTINNEDKIMGFEQSKHTDWIIITAMNQNEYAKEFNKSIVITILVLFIILILVVYLGVYFINRITKPLIEISKLMKRAEEGDYAIDVNITRNDEIGQIQESFKNMISAQSNIIKNILESSNNVMVKSQNLSSVSEEMSSSSQEVANTMQHVAAASSSQANNLQEIVGLMNDLSSKIENVYDELKNVKSESDNAIEKANLGNSEMDKLVKSITEIKNAFEVVISKVGNLSATVKEINNITAAINAISEQTNLLALNAAIEAARAGEAGRGFAVVAEEVRKLAEESKKSTSEIAKLVETIQGDTEEVISTSNEVREFINEQTNIVENSVKTFEEILGSVEKIAPVISKTYKEMDEMEKAKISVIEKVEAVSAVTEENTAASEEVAAASEELSASSQEVASTAQELNSMANDLDNLANNFKIS